MTRKSRLITARKRSLGQGNIFTSVWHEFCSGGCLLPGGGSGPGGLLQGRCLLLGGAWSGGLLPRGVPGGYTPPGRLLLRAVRILLKCILVDWMSSLFCGFWSNLIEFPLRLAV